MDQKIEVYAVIRIDDYESLEDAITVKEILPSLEEVVQEVKRLNEVNKEKGARYFWQATRYFPKGRRVIG